MDEQASIGRSAAKKRLRWITLVAYLTQSTILTKTPCSMDSASTFLTIAVTMLDVMELMLSLLWCCDYIHLSNVSKCSIKGAYHLYVGIYPAFTAKPMAATLP